MCKRIFYSIIVIAALWAAMSFKPNANSKLSIKFENYAGNKPLAFDSVCYKNQFGQPYTVNMFKYYVGNFHLKNKSGQEFISHGYFLINQEDSASMQINIDSIPAGEYNTISFMLGVDSIDNCSGAQSGALDPVNGMFWAWNSGYVFLKMEGISPVSKSTGKRLEFHIGGYRTPNNCIKTIHLELKRPIKIGEGTNNIVKIKADISHLFSSPNPVDFSMLSSITDFHNAKNMADNYSSMFSIICPNK